MRGKVKVYLDKGYGFIDVQGESDMFFHINSLVDKSVEYIHQGQDVEFKIRSTSRGLEAIDVELV